MSEHNGTNPHTHHHPGKSSEAHVDKSIILTALSISNGQVILDAGCGNGYMSKAFSLRTGETGQVYALDPDRDAIETLTTETANSNITPLVGDITRETHVTAGSVDLIYLSNVMHGFTNAQVEGFQKEVKRLLKPQGRLAVVEFKKVTTDFGPPLDIRLSPERLRQIISLTPGECIEVGPYFYVQIFTQKV